MPSVIFHRHGVAWARFKPAFADFGTIYRIINEFLGLPILLTRTNILAIPVVAGVTDSSTRCTSQLPHLHVATLHSWLTHLSNL